MDRGAGRLQSMGSQRAGHDLVTKPPPGYWKHPKCPSSDELVEKLWYMYAMEHYSAIIGAHNSQKGAHLSQF